MSSPPWQDCDKVVILTFRTKNKGKYLCVYVRVKKKRIKINESPPRLLGREMEMTEELREYGRYSEGRCRIF